MLWFLNRVRGTGGSQHFVAERQRLQLPGAHGHPEG